MAVRLIPRTMLDNVFPGLDNHVRGTRTTVRLVELHSLVVRADVAMTGKGLGAAGPKFPRGMDEGRSRVDRNRVTKSSDIPVHITMEGEVDPRGEAGGRKAADAVIPIGSIRPLRPRFQPGEGGVESGSVRGRVVGNEVKVRSSNRVRVVRGPPEAIADGTRVPPHSAIRDRVGQLIAPNVCMARRPGHVDRGTEVVEKPLRRS